MSQCVDQLTKALGVIATDPKIVSFLQANDPQALKQCQEALRNHFNSIEEEDQMNDFNWVGSKWHY